MISVSFQDLNGYSHGTFYSKSNEQVDTWREFVKDLRIDNAAGICSSGEVCLFTILPTVRGKMFLVDHSYNSLTVGMVKYYILAKYGYKKAISILSDGGMSNRELMNLIGEFNIRDESKKRIVNNDWGDRWFRICGAHNIVDEELLKKAARKLTNVCFVHGDLTDLIPHGPFDLLYASNALEHRDRNNKRPIIDKINSLVKPGGYVLVAHQRWNTYESTKVAAECEKIWEPLKEVETTQSACQYVQVLWQKKQ